MATNKALEKANSVNFASPATVVSGDPVLVGILAAVAHASYRADTGEASFDLEGAYFLPVSALSALSPPVGAAMGVGDPVYAVGGALDVATNITTGFTLCADSVNGLLFGNLLDAVVAGATSTVRVRLALGGKNY